MMTPELLAAIREVIRLADEGSIEFSFSPRRYVDVIDLPIEILRAEAKKYE